MQSPLNSSGATNSVDPLFSRFRTELWDPFNEGNKERWMEIEEEILGKNFGDFNFLLTENQKVAKVFENLKMLSFYKQLTCKIYM